MRKLEFTDPRVQYLLKEKFRDAEILTIRGTVALLFKCVAGDPELTKRLYQSLPERLREYVAVSAAPAGNELTDGTSSPEHTVSRTLQIFLNRSRQKRIAPQKIYRNPVILAQEWQAMIADGRVGSRKELAQTLGVSRARVSQYPFQ